MRTLNIPPFTADKLSDRATVLLPTPFSTDVTRATLPRCPGTSEILSSSARRWGLRSSSAVPAIGFCQMLLVISRGRRLGIRAQTGRSCGGSAWAEVESARRAFNPGSGEFLLVSSTATAAVDISIEAITSAARSKASGGRVERIGGVAREVILVWET